MNRIFSISLQFSNKCIIRSIPNVNITQVRNKVTAKASKGKGGKIKKVHILILLIRMNKNVFRYV